MKKPLCGGLVVNKLIEDGVLLCENREAALNLVEWIGPYVFGKKCKVSGITIRKVKTNGKDLVVVC